MKHEQVKLISAKRITDYRENREPRTEKRNKIEYNSLKGETFLAHFADCALNF